MLKNCERIERKKNPIHNNEQTTTVNQKNRKKEEAKKNNDQETRFTAMRACFNTKQRKSHKRVKKNSEKKKP